MSRTIDREFRSVVRATVLLNLSHPVPEFNIVDTQAWKPAKSITH